MPGRSLSSLQTWLRRVPNYVQRFGLVQGIELAVQAELGVGRYREGEFLSLPVPGLTHPVFVRPTRGDLSIFWQVVVRREYDLQQFRHVEAADRWYKRVCESGSAPLILDCGAHIGLASLAFRARYPEAHVLCVEPNKNNVAVLRRNTAPYTDIEVIEGAVWKEAKLLDITNPQGGSTSFRLEEANESPDAVRGYSVGELLARYSGRPPFIVKMDIEGAERDVFEGDVAWMEEVMVIIIELHDWLFPWEGRSGSLWRALSGKQFDVVFTGENLILFNHRLKCASQ